MALTLVLASGVLSCRHAAPVSPELPEGEEPPGSVREPRSDAPSDSPSNSQPSDSGAHSEGLTEKATGPSTDEVPVVDSSKGVLPTRVVRVGLATDLETVTFPCCDSGVVARLGRFDLSNKSPLQVEAAFSDEQKGFFRLQVSALKDEGQARQLAARLQTELGQSVDSRFDAESGLYKVRVGRYATREEAETSKRSLEALGMPGAWVMSEGSGMAEPAMKVRQGGKTYLVHGRWVTLLKAGDIGVEYGGQRYRGKLGVFLNDRGRLNVINELPLEDYLRGVVPKEMGPLVYNESEALKAQSIAARTYTVFHLGEYSAEGYDICATPRCHVYGGVNAEHPITDRILQETRGQVLTFEGNLADSLYTASCGGHTENVRVVFPSLEDRPYLEGVRCGEAGPVDVHGKLLRGVSFPAGVTRRVFPSSAGGKAQKQLEKRLLDLASRANLSAPRDHLRSVQRGELRRFVASAFDLALDPRLLAHAENLEEKLSNPPANWGAESLRQGSYLLKSGLFSGSPKDVVSEAEREELLYQLGQLLYVLKSEEVRFLDLQKGQMKYRLEEGTRSVPLTDGIPTFRLQRGKLSSAPLKLVAGDSLTLVWQGDILEAVVQPVEPSRPGFDRRHDRSTWTRFHTDAKLAHQVQERYPGLGFRGFEVLAKGDSGRVGKIRLLGNEGKTVDVEGLAVRWTLDVPETLFTASRQKPRGRAPGWLFKGKGWGHGVGMCQEGAFGMAQRGHGFREILSHYYPGTRVAELGGSRVVESVQASGD